MNNRLDPKDVKSLTLHPSLSREVNRQVIIPKQFLGELKVSLESFIVGDDKVIDELLRANECNPDYFNNLNLNVDNLNTCVQIRNILNLFLILIDEKFQIFIAQRNDREKVQKNYATFSKSIVFLKCFIKLFDELDKVDPSELDRIETLLFNYQQARLSLLEIKEKDAIVLTEEKNILKHIARLRGEIAKIDHTSPYLPADPDFFNSLKNKDRRVRSSLLRGLKDSLEAEAQYKKQRISNQAASKQLINTIEILLQKSLENIKRENITLKDYFYLSTLDYAILNDLLSIYAKDPNPTILHLLAISIPNAHLYQFVNQFASLQGSNTSHLLLAIQQTANLPTRQYHFLALVFKYNNFDNHYLNTLLTSIFSNGLLSNANLAEDDLGKLADLFKKSESNALIQKNIIRLITYPISSKQRIKALITYAQNSNSPLEDISYIRAHRIKARKSATDKKQNLDGLRLIQKVEKDCADRDGRKRQNDIQREKVKQQRQAILLREEDLAKSIREISSSHPTITDSKTNANIDLTQKNIDTPHAPLDTVEEISSSDDVTRQSGTTLNVESIKTTLENYLHSNTDLTYSYCAQHIRNIMKVDMSNSDRLKLLQEIFVSVTHRADSVTSDDDRSFKSTSSLFFNHNISSRDKRHVRALKQCYYDVLINILEDNSVDENTKSKLIKETKNSKNIINYNWRCLLFQTNSRSSLDRSIHYFQRQGLVPKS
ncbi:MAG: hypothetical protein H0W64_02305 [Gammaproteobacteria bacterium]|nr:hypothetical protein [Gammaproteobacteria bacterium]